jgi:hypothetical protein
MLQIDRLPQPLFRISELVCFMGLARRYARRFRLSRIFGGWKFGRRRSAALPALVGLTCRSAPFKKSKGGWETIRLF